MSQIRADVAILGSGFAGSLCALLLRRLGIEVVLVDKSRHPRFAIGESSTPIANMIMRDLAQKYDLPALAPLGTYGSWRDAYPNILCGRKRGFSYFQHRANRPFIPSRNHANELLVAASNDEYRCDTHWLRADIDHFLVEEARRAGIAVWDETLLSAIDPVTRGWRLEGQRYDDPVTIEASFLIDAAGPASLLARRLELPDLTSELHTHSRALYAHFTGIPRWGACISTSDHPFPCDDAAVHHCIDARWMWMLRFADDRVSAGFALDARAYPASSTENTVDEWQRLVDGYPSLAALLGTAEFAAPPGRLIATGRLQRLWGRAAGSNWALLPHAAGFIDPLHSTGIAHSLSGVERLTRILADHLGKNTLPRELESYSSQIVDELRLIDLLVAGCYRAFGRFDLLVPYTMLYFAAATTFEQHRLKSSEIDETNRSFLCADDPQFVDIVERTYRGMIRLAETSATPAEAQRFAEDIRRAIEPYNAVGLFNPRIPNMYEYTGV